MTEQTKKYIGSYRAIFSAGAEKKWKGRENYGGTDRGYLIVASDKGVLYKATQFSAKGLSDYRRDTADGDYDIVAAADREGELRVLVNSLGEVNKKVAEEFGLPTDLATIEANTRGIGKPYRSISTVKAQI